MYFRIGFMFFCFLLLSTTSYIDEAECVPNRVLDKQKPEQSIENTNRRSLGRCRCRKTNFNKRFFESYAVARVYMVHSELAHDSYLTPILRKCIYKFTVINLYKGKAVFRPNPYMYGEAYMNVGFCGVTFVRHQLYVLFLDKPRDVTRTPGGEKVPLFYLHRCQNHYVWRGLTDRQRRFLKIVKLPTNAPAP